MKKGRSEREQMYEKERRRREGKENRKKIEKEGRVNEKEGQTTDPHSSPTQR